VKKFYNFTSANEVNKIHVVAYVPKRIKGILQISHGMIEHIGRYDDFARFLCDKGFLVVGNDHLGHGNSVFSPSDYGYMGPGDASRNLVRDLYTITKNIKKIYGDYPYFIFGHSMGSFLVRRYLMEYNDVVDGAIIMGTGDYNLVELGFARILLKIMDEIYGDRHISPLINKLMFSAYNKRISNPNSDKDWISRDLDVVTRYREDPKCHFVFTNNGIKALINTLMYIKLAKNEKKLTYGLPVLMLSGSEDPVGGYTKGANRVFERYEDLGLKVRHSIYEGARHELLNELDKEKCYDEILHFLEEELE